jgi:hypothetical protein
MLRKPFFYSSILFLFFAASAAWADISQYDFLANLRTLPARSAFSLDLDRHLARTRRQAIARFDARFRERLLKEYSVWTLGNVGLLSVHKNEGGFNAFSNGAQIGIDFLNDGGIFAAFRKIGAFYDDSQASGQEIEAGLYKYFLDIDFLGIISAFNIWGAAAFSNFTVDNAITFNSRVAKGGFEADFGRADIIPFLGIRGAYASNGSASDRDGFFLEQDDYLRAEILGGLKKSLELKDFLFSLKTYAVFLPIREDGEIKVKNKRESEIIKPLGEEKFFGGANLLTQWRVSERFIFSLLAGAETDMDGTVGFYGNFTANYRFLKINIKDARPREEE